VTGGTPVSAASTLTRKFGDVSFGSGSDLGVVRFELPEELGEISAGEAPFKRLCHLLVVLLEAEDAVFEVVE